MWTILEPLYYSSFVFATLVQGIVDFINVLINTQPGTNQVPIYISEITPKNIRGGFASAHTVKRKHYRLRLKNQWSV